MRRYFEALEESELADYAVKSILSKGRCYNEQDSETRTCFQRDRDRIIHSKSFRRLRDKTQVFIASVSDHYRSRLTHTIEVAQISRHLARLLRLNEDLTECIALAHDLGHSPFGHSGEDVLNELLLDYGGFEHNLHSLRIVEEIEQKYPAFPGLNLSFEVREGLKKHHTPWDNPEGHASFVSLEAQIANVADEIAYNNHDIDDGLSSGILVFEELLAHVELFQMANDFVSDTYSSLQAHERFHLVNSRIISQQVKNVYEASLLNIERLDIKTLNDIQEIKSSIVDFSVDMKELNQQLRGYLYANFYQSEPVQDLNASGQDMIRSIFTFLIQHLHYVPDSFLQLQQRFNYHPASMVGFYIAGMTDSYATRFCNVQGLN